VRIGGLQQTTMLDFPGRISAVVFTRGCNFSCPYCHNASLVPRSGGELARADILAFLTRRRGLLEGVVISGGEPTLQDDLPEFCSTLKDLGYAVKLDTNGGRPEVLRLLLQSKLLDYVAMDIKADPKRYPREISPKDAGAAVGESISLLNACAVPHEFRIPCVAPFIGTKSFQAVMKLLPGGASVFLQTVREAPVLDPSFFRNGGRALRREEMESLKKLAEAGGLRCAIR
jgi:pyruvate formate lyase activating enzyme